ncbi:MAG TPA: chemotaxis protein CheW [Kofleriaceae bacterium]|nr:chemotaxis protein CheW [Kofleriaceae bacterium]
MADSRAPSEPGPPGSGSRGSGSRGSGSRGSAESLVESGAVTVFLLGDQPYGMAVSATREIVAVENLIDVPRAPSPVLGLFPLRGGAIALVDTAAILGLDVETSTKRALVVVRGDTPLCGITVDTVLGVVRLESLELTPAEPGRETGPMLGFLTMPDGRIITLLDTDAVLRRIEALAANAN